MATSSHFKNSNASLEDAVAYAERTLGRTIASQSEPPKTSEKITPQDVPSNSQEKAAASKSPNNSLEISKRKVPPAISTLMMISTALLIIGGISSLIIFILAVDTMNALYFACGVVMLAVTVIQWAVHRVFAGIADDVNAIRFLKEMESRTG